MATLLAGAPVATRDDRFFLISAAVMAALIFGAFSFQLAMGRSTFAVPLLIHAHAVTFMGWVVLYFLQTVFAATGSMALHRRLGWIGAAWMMAMVGLGTAVTVMLVRAGRAPFFFQPGKFLILNPIEVVTFAGLTIAAIVLRRRTDWHRRLHFCGMATLLSPAFGRLLPMPLLIPFAFEAAGLAPFVFPAAGVLYDLRRSGRVHPAWLWGILTMLLSMLLIEAVAASPAAPAIYRAATAGSPGAAIAPFAYPAPPPA